MAKFIYKLGARAGSQTSVSSSSILSGPCSLKGIFVDEQSILDKTESIYLLSSAKFF